MNIYNFLINYLKYDMEKEIEETRPSTSQTNHTENQVNIPLETKNKKKPKQKIVLTQEQIEQYKQQANIINPLFIAYYKEILNLPNKEYESFLSFCTKDLPITFRISKIK